MTDREAYLLRWSRRAFLLDVATDMVNESLVRRTPVLTDREQQQFRRILLEVDALTREPANA
jgi:hypothetical protein